MKQSTKSDQLYLQLRRKIARMQDGETFPTIRQLMAEYGVSQSSVTPAVNLLKEKGLLKAHVGRGTIVCRSNSKPVMLLLQHNWPVEIFPCMRQAIREEAEKSGFQFEYQTYDYHDDVTMLLHTYEADIIVIDGIADDLLSSEQISAITDAPAPVILSRNSVPVRRINYVCGDNNAAGATAATYLAQMGHKKLGILLNEPHLHTANAFYRGFVSSAEANGCQVEVLDCEIQPGERPDRKIKQFMKEFKKGKYNFTALFPVSVTGAVLVKENLDELGIRIPEDLSLITVGSHPREPWLTVLDSGVEEYRKLIIQMAEDILGGRSTLRNRQIEFSLKLLESTSVSKMDTVISNSYQERIAYA